VKPEEFPEHLPRSPLALVIGQVRFAPVLDIEDYITKIQKGMRDLDLPGYVEQRIQQLSIGPKIETDQIKRFVFDGQSKTECVFLTNRFVVLANSTHDRFETFRKRLGEVLDVVFRCAQPKYVEQTGLRYINLLRDLDGIQSEDMVVPALRGISADKLGCENTHNTSVVRALTSSGQLTIRSVQLEGPAFLPPDLEIETMEFPNCPEPNERFRLLDIDHVSMGKNIELNAVTTSFQSLHESTRLGFLRSVTDDAIRLWSQS
jgi:uncharacterized protein (TIGR04255 family)